MGGQAFAIEPNEGTGQKHIKPRVPRVAESSRKKRSLLGEETLRELLRQRRLGRKRCFCWANVQIRVAGAPSVRQGEAKMGMKRDERAT